MDSDLAPVYHQIMDSVSAEDVFGVVDVVLPTDEQLKYLKVEFEKLHVVTNPTRWTNPEDRDQASDADRRLIHFYEKAQERIRAGTYGLGGLKNFRPGLKSFETSRRRYYLGEILAEGDISTVYEGFCAIGDELAGEVVIKLVSDPADNDLVQNEIRLLEELHRVEAPQWKHLPFLLDTFITEGRQGLILRKIRGYDLFQVRSHLRYKDGVHPKDMVWMLNRALSALYYVHSRGIIHCNLDPSHIMIKPDDHNLFLVGWSCGAFKPSETGDTFKVYTPDFSPPEVQKKLPPIPPSDIYSLGKVMIWLLGGDPKTNEMPERVEGELQRFLKGFVLNSPIQRPRDARQLHQQLISIVESLWGRRRFRPFPMD